MTTTAFPDTDADKRLILAAVVHVSSANAILRKTVDGWNRKKNMTKARAALTRALDVLDEEEERLAEAELQASLEREEGPFETDAAAAAQLQGAA